ncbi:DUF3800 domain-containing protein [Pararhizobium gei]|uniref:DUF3800 domain-containing protein n=1 Tax=Pararhizobium gei TaxID=1395951 RepID=UPI0023DCDB8D|nr:DUF3800 domain-containing protein [Rhizobium gei]
MENGEYIFYADESGDHSLVSIDEAYPVFVLSVCGFKILEYTQKTVPSFQKFKFRYFGHDMAVLHEREIRKQIGDFTFLTNIEVRENFLRDLTKIVDAARFDIFSCIIDKRKFRADFFPDNPYRIALSICLMAVHRHLKNIGKHEQTYYFVFEKRGEKEDKELELEFRRIVAGENQIRVRLDSFKLRFADKKSNSTGMQLADLTARPLGLSYLHPQQSNRAMSIIQSKLCKVRIPVNTERGIYAPSGIKAKSPG